MKFNIVEILDKIAEEPEVSFRSKYRLWPFVAILVIGTFVGCFSILLPPTPDSPFFIDPSVKFIAVMALFISLVLKPTIRLAKKN